MTILYPRVSTRPQLKDLNRQIAVLETYAEIKGWKNCLTIYEKQEECQDLRKNLGKLAEISNENYV